MTPEEHKQRHIELHKALDELFADYISHHPIYTTGFLSTPIEKLLKWAHEQTLNPTDLIDDNEVNVK